MGLVVQGVQEVLASRHRLRRVEVGSGGGAGRGGGGIGGGPGVVAEVGVEAAEVVFRWGRKVGKFW